MPERILIIDPVHISLAQGLMNHGFEVYNEPDITADQVIDRILELNINGLVIRSKMFVSGEFFHGLNSLKWIARAGVGLDNIDALAASKSGVVLLNAEGANARSVAEHALGMILTFLHKINRADIHVKWGEWNREMHRGRELSALNIGIIGVGNTGSNLMQLLSGFGVKIWAYDKYKSGFAGEHVTECSDVSQIYEHADLISYHVPLTDETREMINVDVLSRLQRKPIIVNTSRGGIMDVFALKNALNEGVISGLLLDVWPTEPPQASEDPFFSIYKDFIQRENVIFSPHVAGWSVESYEHISKRLLDNILKFSNPRD